MEGTLVKEAFLLMQSVSFYFILHVVHHVSCALIEHILGVFVCILHMTIDFGSSANMLDNV